MWYAGRKGEPSIIVYYPHVQRSGWIERAITAILGCATPPCEMIASMMGHLTAHCVEVEN
jgi:hypothetical protein